MLSIGKLGAGQERYYPEKVAEGAEDYYSGEGEAEGQWIGSAAAQFDLEGKVEPDQLRNGRQLGARRRRPLRVRRSIAPGRI